MTRSKIDICILSLFIVVSPTLCMMTEQENGKNYNNGQSDMVLDVPHRSDLPVKPNGSFIQENQKGSTLNTAVAIGAQNLEGKQQLEGKSRENPLMENWKQSSATLIS